MPSPSLLVLAAGMGSRYGGLKQIEPVGPSGETILDYGVFDAIRSGFGRVVFVIRRDFEAIFREQVGAKYAGRIAVDYVFQELTDLPDGFAPPTGRQKPWGTGHAVWCARAAIRENFAVINADDFYGRDSFVQLGRFLQEAPGDATGPLRLAIVGFRLARTLSEHGAVSRGVCSVDGRRLTSIVERTGITPADVGPGRPYSGDEPVSMNCWGFSAELFPALETCLREFLSITGQDPKAEFYLPSAISSLIASGQAKVEVLSTDADWFGVTYREDRPRVVAALAELLNAGKYPRKLS